MLEAVGSLAVLGATLGTILGIASRYLKVEENPLEAELEGMLPGSQCGQCGYAGCRQAAAALASGEAPVTLCPPGGRALAAAVAEKLGVTVDLSGAEEAEPEIAFINEDVCIGCMRCIQECSTDAIVGAAKMMHTVIQEVCHGCGKCGKICPTEAIEMQAVPVTLASWHWHKPVSRMVH
ncbi:MAG TPA: RnfABCDGE type electron transport complex subunit B [Candidatus Omnitrophota bacterium]|nr:RnfABCDGE type electron transport complex subunit B [Candidatus Omnitrophota bacterium]